MKKGSRLPLHKKKKGLVRDKRRMRGETCLYGKKKHGGGRIVFCLRHANEKKPPAQLVLRKTLNPKQKGKQILGIEGPTRLTQAQRKKWEEER